MWCRRLANFRGAVNIVPRVIHWPRARTLLQSVRSNEQTGQVEPGLTNSRRGDSFKVFLFDDTLTFFDYQYFIHIRVSNLINHSARPADLDEVYFRPLLQAEVQPQIALSDVAPTAPDFIDLRQIPGDDSDSRSDAIAIALHADGLDQNRIIRVAAVIA